MVKTERRRQKKLAAKKSKQRRQQRELAQQKRSLSSLAGMMASASSGRILHCYLGKMRDAAEENGMVTVMLIRSGPRGQVALAHFLVDLWCLGVKDCTGKLVGPSLCREILDDVRAQFELETVASADAHAVVVEGLHYAESFGLAPHRDYPKLAPIWTGIPVGQMPPGLELGRNGRPCYIVGPYDDDVKQMRILRSLESHAGKGNFESVSMARQRVEQLRCLLPDARHERMPARLANKLLE